MLLFKCTSWSLCLCSCSSLHLQHLPCWLLTDTYQPPLHPHRQLKSHLFHPALDPALYTLAKPTSFMVTCMLITSTGAVSRDPLCIPGLDTELAEEDVNSKKNLLKENIIASQAQQALLKVSYKTRKT